MSVDLNLGTLMLPEEIAGKKMIALKEIFPVNVNESGDPTESDQEYLRRIIKDYLNENMTRGQKIVDQKELQNTPPEPSIDII